MRTLSLLVMVGSWATVPAGYTNQAAGSTPMQLAHNAFDAGAVWSITDYWREASYGELDFTVKYVNAGVLQGTITPNPKIPGDFIGPPNTGDDRARVVADALRGAGERRSDYDLVIAWVNPPCNAGGAGSGAALLDWGRVAVPGEGPFWGHDFFCHEFGHVLGFEHTVARDPAGVLQDYEASGMHSCVMGFSGMGYPGGPPPTYALPQNSGRAWWGNHVGPLPAAASLWRYLDGFSTSASVVEVTGWEQAPRKDALQPHSLLTRAGATLLVAPTPVGDYLLEWRQLTGRDGRVQPELKSLDPGPGLYVHRKTVRSENGLPAGRIEIVAAALPARRGTRWRAPNANLVFTVIAEIPQAPVPTIRVATSTVGAQPPHTVRQALKRVTGKSSGVIPTDVGETRPLSLTDWILST